jgi:hypothetical protein
VQGAAADRIGDGFCERLPIPSIVDAICDYGGPQGMLGEDPALACIRLGAAGVRPPRGSGVECNSLEGGGLR